MKLKNRLQMATVAVIIGGMMITGAIDGLAQTQPSSGKAFTIHGFVKNPVPGGKVYLEYGASSRRIDSTQIDATNQFTLKGNEIEGGSFYLVNLFNQQKVGMLIEGGETLEMTAELNPDRTKATLMVKGSKNMEYYQKLMSMFQDMNEKSKVWQAQFEEAHKKKDNPRIAKINQEYEAASTQFVSNIKQMLPEMGTSLVALFATNFLKPEEEFATLDTLARKFEKENATGVQAKAFIGNIARMRGVLVGAVAPDIVLSTPNGQPASLSALRGKYVLIDFWASWCGPCRLENPNIVRMYTKYKDRGFTIYGVSLDRDKESWTRAIDKDRLTWTHVSDLKQWQSTAAQQYGVTSIPMSFLLDKEGKIVAKNLRGLALEQKLEELLPNK